MDENGVPESVFEEEVARLMVKLDKFMADARHELAEIRADQKDIKRRISSLDK